MLIAIDAGHGGKDSGAVGGKGTKEKDIVLSMAKQLQKSLQTQGFQTFLTRQTDVYLTLSNRAQNANTQEADYFISLHCNSYIEPRANGCELYVYAKQGETYAFGEKVYTSLNDAIKLTSRGVKEAPFTVLTKTAMPAILIEVAFISNPVEEAYLNDPAFQHKAVEAITKGVCTHVGMPYNATESEAPKEPEVSEKPAQPETPETKPVHWGQGAIDEIRALGLITSDKAPTQQVTWAEFATVLLRMQEKK